MTAATVFCGAALQGAIGFGGSTVTVPILTAAASLLARWRARGPARWFPTVGRCCGIDARRWDLVRPVLAGVALRLPIGWLVRQAAATFVLQVLNGACVLITVALQLRPRRRSVGPAPSRPR